MSRTPDDRRLLDYPRIADADVVGSQNQPPLVQKKLRLDYASISTVKPDVVFVSITGFGLTGTRANLTCYDLIAERVFRHQDITGAAVQRSRQEDRGRPPPTMHGGSGCGDGGDCRPLRDAARRKGKGRLIDRKPPIREPWSVSSHAGDGCLSSSG